MIKDWKGLKVVIVGAARQGVALARYLAGHGARVVLTDLRSKDDLAGEIASLQELPAVKTPVEWVLGEHPLGLLDGANLLCLSGGAPPTIQLAVEAQKRGIPLSNDSQIFLENVPCKVIGITGSAGKSTTTSLVGSIAQQAFTGEAQNGSRRRKAWVGGNIGSPLISWVDEMQADDLAVMELSSFQLELMDRSPQVAAILNITPNHLDRHGSMEVYTEIKARIIAHQAFGDIAVLGRDDPISWSLAQKVHSKLMSFGITEPSGGDEGTFLKDDNLYLRIQEIQDDMFVMSRSEIRVPGAHNLQNVLAACAIAAAAGLPVAAMRAGISSFEGMPHRLEYVRRWGGADWYNDSIATAPERTMAAIKSFNRPIILLAGGRDKGLPWDELAEMIYQRVDHLIVFGEARDIILKALVETGSVKGISATIGNNEDSILIGEPTITVCMTLKEAVSETAKLVEPGDVVLLSPGGTSFDEFFDFEERGACFVQLVRDLT